MKGYKSLMNDLLNDIFKSFLIIKLGHVYDFKNLQWSFAWYMWTWGQIMNPTNVIPHGFN